MLFDSPPFTGGPLRQAYLWSQPKLRKGRGAGCCCGHGAVLSQLYLCSQPKLARYGAGGWLLLCKCRTVPRATIGAASVLLLRTLVGTVAVVATAVLRRGPQDIIAGVAAAATVDLRWGGKGWDAGIYAIALEEAMAAQIPKLTTGAAESVEPPWLSRHAHLRLVPGSFVSLAPDSRSRAAVMWLRAKQMLRWW